MYTIVKHIKKFVLNGYIQALSLVVVFVLCTLLIRSINPSTSIADLKLAYPKLTLVGYNFLLFIPLLWLVSSNVWRSTTSLSRKFLLVSIAIFLVSTIFPVRYGINAGGFFIAYSILYAAINRRVYKPYFIFYIFALYFILLLVSILWTPDTVVGFKKLRTYLPFVTLAVAFSCFRLNRKEIEQLFVVFFKFTIIFVLFSLLGWVYESTRMQVPLTDWFVFHKTVYNNLTAYSIVYSWFGYDHPTYNSLSYLLSIALGFGVYSVNRKQSVIGVGQIAFLIAISFVLNTLVQSRLGLMSLLALTTFGIGTILYPKSKQFIIYVSGLLLLVGLFFTLSQNKLFQFISDPVREQEYATAFYYIKSHYWLGTGIGGMPAILQSEEVAKSLGYTMNYIIGIGNPHNQFIGDLMQTGILGLVIIVLMVGYLFYTSLEKRNWLLFNAMIVFSMLMYIEMPLELLKGTTVFVPFVCIAIQWKKKELDAQNK